MNHAPDYYVFPTDLYNSGDLTLQHMLEVVPVVEREYYDLEVAENQELRALAKELRGSVAFRPESEHRTKLLARIKDALGEPS